MKQFEYSLATKRRLPHLELLYIKSGVPGLLRTFSIAGSSFDQDISTLSTGMQYTVSCAHYHKCTGFGLPIMSPASVVLTNNFHGCRHPYKTDACVVADREKTEPTSPDALIPGDRLCLPRQLRTSSVGWNEPMVTLTSCLHSRHI